MLMHLDQPRGRAVDRPPMQAARPRRKVDCQSLTSGSDQAGEDVYRQRHDHDIEEEGEDAVRQPDAPEAA